MNIYNLLNLFFGSMVVRLTIVCFLFNTNLTLVFVSRHIFFKLSFTHLLEKIVWKSMKGVENRTYPEPNFSTPNMHFWWFCCCLILDATHEQRILSTSAALERCRKVGRSIEQPNRRLIRIRIRQLVAPKQKSYNQRHEIASLCPRFLHHMRRCFSIRCNI